MGRRVAYQVYDGLVPSFGIIKKTKYRLCLICTCSFYHYHYHDEQSAGKETRWTKEKIVGHTGVDSHSFCRTVVSVEISTRS